MDKTVFKNILQFLIILIFNSFLAQNSPKKLIKATIINDTISKKDTIVAPKESLQAVVDYKADDIRRDVPKRMIYLNKNAQVKYQDMQIDADYISIDEERS